MIFEWFSTTKFVYRENNKSINLRPISRWHIKKTDFERKASSERCCNFQGWKFWRNLTWVSFTITLYICRMRNKMWNNSYSLDRENWRKSSTNSLVLEFNRNIYRLLFMSSYNYNYNSGALNCFKLLLWFSL